jgi:membrane protein implicated in regulation of membrane protease activity
MQTIDKNSLIYIVPGKEECLMPTDFLIGLGGAGFCCLVTGYLVLRFVVAPLSKHQNAGAVEKQSLIGHNAAVSEAIPQGGFGKITYYANGNTFSAPAKAENGGAISKNETVEIVIIERNTYFVRKKM